MDLSPAKWIWLPSQRTLACTFVLFRREIELDEVPKSAAGWIVADSRYRLTVNGHRVQWGPAPHDPRHAEADPVDLAPYLRAGKNCIGVEVLFYGHGDGTWPFGKPGLLLNLEIDGVKLVSDAMWKCQIDRAHRPGQYARWFLRALQEEFDARLHPFGWDEPGYDDSQWLPAQEFRNPANRSAFAGGYSDYTREVWMTRPEDSTLIARTIPLLREERVAAEFRFANPVEWRRDPRDWFEFRVPDSFKVGPTSSSMPSPQPEAFTLTYELLEAMVGWPGFTIDAPEGTVVELMIQESHDHEKTPWLDSHIYAWSRFVCREGVNHFETFDFEAGRWLQLHIHGHSRPVTVTGVGIRRRTFPWPHQPEIESDEPALQRLFEASVNTLNNSAQETIVDGMGRERQPYSGDGAHQLHAIRYAFGETRLPARFLRTFAQGQLIDGVFADSWPAVDRLQRIWERNVDASDWGPLLDHSVGFVFDHHHHWMQSGDFAPIEQNWPRLVRFVEALEAISGSGTLPVEHLGVNAVWIDHEAFDRQSAKHCAFNLYVVAMIRHAFLPMANRIGHDASRLSQWADALLSAITQRYWNEAKGLFLSQATESGEGRLADDRSLATAVIYDLCPGGRTDACVEALATRPKWMGASYPANMVWNYWALAKAGRIQPVIDDLRTRWANMRSVLEANALQEFWTTRPDTTNLMSHCPLAPLNVLYQGVMGLWPAKPGFETIELRPQLGDLKRLRAMAHTPAGPVCFDATPEAIWLTTPAETRLTWQGETRVLAAGSSVTLKR